MKQNPYPQTNIQLESWIVLWKNIQKISMGGRLRIRVELQCVACSTIITRDASDVLKNKKIPLNCVQCNSNKDRILKLHQNKEDEILDNGVTILWKKVFATRKENENYFYVPILCSCGVEYSTLIRFLNKRKYKGLCLACANKIKQAFGEKNGNWKKGVIKSRQYTNVYIDDSSPYFSMCQRKTSPKSGYVPEHRLKMAEYLKRPLNRWEHVHHINQNKLDNRIENLQLVTPEQHCSITSMEMEIRKLSNEVEKLKHALGSTL